MSGTVVKTATISNISNTNSLDELETMVNIWLDEEGLPQYLWDELELDEPYQAEILRVAITRWEALSEKEIDIA